MAEPCSKVYGKAKPDEPQLAKTVGGSCVLASSDAGTSETSHPDGFSFNNYKICGALGCEIDGIDHDEVKGLRFWKVLPNKNKPVGFTSIDSSIGKRVELLGDVKLLTDKSVAVELPCDTPYLMSGVDSEGRVLKRDQVPQSLRPGGKRVYTGCHFHSRQGKSYEGTLASALTEIPKLGGTQVPVMVNNAIQNLG